MVVITDVRTHSPLPRTPRTCQPRRDGPDRTRASIRPRPCSRGLSSTRNGMIARHLSLMPSHTPSARHTSPAACRGKSGLRSPLKTSGCFRKYARRHIPRRLRYRISTHAQGFRHIRKSVSKIRNKYKGTSGKKGCRAFPLRHQLAVPTSLTYIHIPV